MAAALERSLTEHLQSINATLDPHEQLECIVVTDEAWTVDNDLITRGATGLRRFQSAAA